MTHTGAARRAGLAALCAALVVFGWEHVMVARASTPIAAQAGRSGHRNGHVADGRMPVIRPPAAVDPRMKVIAPSVRTRSRILHPNGDGRFTPRAGAGASP